MNYISNRNINLSESEKKELIPLISYLLEIAFKIRQNGIFDIQNDIESSENEFLKLTYRLVTSGFEPTRTNQILINFINFSNVNNIDYIKSLMIIDTFNISPSSPNYLLNINLFSYLGFDFKKIYMEELKKTLDEFLYNELFDFFEGL